MCVCLLSAEQDCTVFQGWLLSGNLKCSELTVPCLGLPSVQKRTYPLQNSNLRNWMHGKARKVTTVFLHRLWTRLQSCLGGCVILGRLLDLSVLREALLSKGMAVNRTHGGSSGDHELIYERGLQGRALGEPHCLLGLLTAPGSGLCAQQVHVQPCLALCAQNCAHATPQGSPRSPGATQTV